MDKTQVPPNIKFINYYSEAQMPDIMKLVQADLSEPYSIYTYRYFINNWSKLCFLVSVDPSSMNSRNLCKILIP